MYGMFPILNSVRMNDSISIHCHDGLDGSISGL